MDSLKSRNLRSGARSLAAALAVLLLLVSFAQAAHLCKSSASYTSSVTVAPGADSSASDSPCLLCMSSHVSAVTAPSVVVQAAGVEVPLPIALPVAAHSISTSFALSVRPPPTA